MGTNNPHFYNVLGAVEWTNYGRLPNNGVVTISKKNSFEYIAAYEIALGYDTCAIVFCREGAIETVGLLGDNRLIVTCDSTGNLTIKNKMTSGQLPANLYVKEII